MTSWQEEKRSAYLYRVLSEQEKDTPRQALFLELAKEADSQAELWAGELAKTGYCMLETYAPDMRVRIVAWLVCRFGPRRMKPILAAINIRGVSVYSSHYPNGHSIPASLNEAGASHRGGGTSGGLRAAVFGVNDGLVSIACLVMGVAGGAASESGIILLAGMAGLLAGAFSIAAGEYVSMRSQREMFEYQIGLERDELAQYPEEEASELALIYTARGMPEEEAKTLAKRMVANPELGLDTLAREELGLNPDELGSPWAAAISSFLAFMAGGVIPLLPFLLGVQHHALPASIVLTGLALFGVGAVLSLFTGRSAFKSGLRMMAIGGTAGVVTYLIGDMLGARLI
ncbi:MAG TPA: VIT1/CCC1 transporter family protein [Methylophilaceae bacterium]|nr:VIT1/CCC1 transporter family protein [Methylophilaceae bacterium]